MEVCGDTQRPWDSWGFFCFVLYCIQASCPLETKDESMKVKFIKEGCFFMHSFFFCQSWFPIPQIKTHQKNSYGSRKGRDVTDQEHTWKAWLSSFKSKGAGFFNSCQQLFIQHWIRWIWWKIQAVETGMCSAKCKDNISVLLKSWWSAEKFWTTCIIGIAVGSNQGEAGTTCLGSTLALLVLRKAAVWGGENSWLAGD